MIIITFFILGVVFGLFIGLLLGKAEEKQGEWKAYEDESQICATEFVCSICRESFCSSELTDEEFFEMMKHCPNCGTRMCGGSTE